MPDWSPPPLPPRLAAARQLPLVGRRYELETFQALWAEAEHGRRQAVFLGGEPGAGKTRLAAELAGALHDDGVAVLVGTSAVDIGVPYQPFTEMLDQLFSSTASRPVADLLGDQDRRELARLSPGLEGHLQVEVDGEPGDARRDLFAAVVRLCRTLAEQRPLALLFDDLHWAHLPTLALLENIVGLCADIRLLVVATFRTTAPDRSDELAATVAELHRQEGVRRLDLGGLDTDAIAEYLSLRGGLTLRAARAPAAVLRERTGGNPFLLRELWTDLERKGGVSALRHSNRVPASIADALGARLAGMGQEVQRVVELAAVLGDSFDLATLVSASETDHAQTMAFVDSATALGLIEEVAGTGDLYSFVHSLTRQAVLDRMPPSRRILLHARAAQALERQPAHVQLVARLAHHYVAAYSLGFHEQALRYTAEAGRLAERGLAFEEAAMWFERAAALPDCEPSVRAAMHLQAAGNWVRAGRFPSARRIYDELVTTAEPEVRLLAAVGYEDTNWRPGRPDARAVDLLSMALEHSAMDPHDPRYVRALGSLSRALNFAGERDRAREVGSRAIEHARSTGDDKALSHALTTSLWHGITPDMAARQLERTGELARLAERIGDDETIGTAANFEAMVSYMCGRPDDLDRARSVLARVAQSTGQPYYRHIYGCIMQAHSFLRGEFGLAEHWANEALDMDDTFGDDMTEGPHGVQMFMIRRETGGLERFRGYLDGSETFVGRWVPALLALYTELDVRPGMERALEHLLDREPAARTDEARWPMELVFLVEGALALRDRPAVERLREMLADYEGMNLASGALIAVFGSADRYLGRIDDFLGDHSSAERHYEVALELDRKMHSLVHEAETLSHKALLVARLGRVEEAQRLAEHARRSAASTGQVRILRTLSELEPGPVAGGPGGMTSRELDVLKLLAAGLSNREIGDRLHISMNTAANHVRSILVKTGATNRTQAAIYAAQHQLV